MKTKLMTILAFAASSFVLTGCEKDYDNIAVPDKFTDALHELYPDATRVTWDREGKKGKYYVADFWRSGMNAEAEASFTSGAVWRFTTTEINRIDVPQVVTDAIANSKYSVYRIDDIDLYESPTDVYYIFELENEPNDIHVRVSPDGTIR